MAKKDSEQVMTLKGSSFDKRIRRLRKALKDEKVDGILVTDLTNIRYLSGFGGSFGLLLVTLKDTVFLTDFRYIETAEKAVCADEVMKVSQDHMDDVQREMRKRKVRRLGFEAKTLPYSDYQRLAEKIGERKVRPLKDTVEKLRMVKDDEEIARIRKAVRLTERALRHIQGFLEPGTSERDLATELEVFFKLNGGGETGFSPTVAFGKGCSMPHYASTNRKLKATDMVLIDLGASLEGYHADLTRTWLSRSMSAKEREIYSIVLEAQQAAIEWVKPGAAFRAIDEAARSVISRAGYGDRFGHGLGHGIGLRVHELPRLARKSEGRCRKGMVFTIEPGIYLPGWGGVRIEDDVLVTEKGCEVLSSYPRSPRSWL
ncbi:MAG: Xaa-Pro peptidase family protein [bacterium]|nr:Xaa-Pro peptidase family protein [bacterium]